MSQRKASKGEGTLSGRLRLTMILLSLVPLGAAGLLALNMLWTVLGNSFSFLGEEIKAISREANRLAAHLDNRLLTLQGMTEAPLAQLPAPNRQELLEHLVRRDPDLALVALWSQQGQLLALAGPGKAARSTLLDEAEGPRARALRQALEQALQGRPWRSPVLACSDTGPLLLMSTPAPSGALLAWVRLEDLLRAFQATRFPGQGTVWLLDGDGRVLAASGVDPGRLGPRAAVPEGMQFVEHGGERYLSGALPVRDTSWHLLWEYPVPGLQEAMQGLLWRTGILVLVALATAWTLGGILARRVAGPVEVLSRRALALSRGDYGTPVETLRSYREISELAHSFETMRAHLAASQEEVTRLYQRTRQLLSERVGELQLLYAVSEAFASGLGFQGLARVVVDYVSGLFPGAGVAFYLGDSSTGLSLQALGGAQGSPEPPARLPGGPDPLVLEGEEAREMARGRFSGQFSTWCAVPLVEKGRPLGILELALPEPLSPEALDLLRALGREAGLAVANSRLYSQVLAEKRFNEAVVETMADGVLTLDAEGRLTSFNRAAERMLGWSRSEVLGRSADEVFGEAAPAGGWRALLRTPAPPPPFEATVTARGGAVKVLHFSPTLPPLQEGVEGARAVVVFRDISRIRELEDLRRDLAATMSHELRTPLTAIKGYLATLMHPRARFEPETTRSYLAIINHQVDQLNRLVHDLLEAARLNSQALVVNARPTDMCALVVKAISECRQAHPQHPVVLEARPPLTAHCDPDQISYVLQHLLSNAVKYSLPGGEVKVRCWVEEDSVCVAVKDNGVGIPLDQQEAIFEMFHRVEKGDTRLHYGVGVGLFIARRVVEAHGGSIQVESAPGCGSTFTIRVPAVQPVEHREQSVV